MDHAGRERTGRKGGCISVVCVYSSISQRANSGFFSEKTGFFGKWVFQKRFFYTGCLQGIKQFWLERSPLSFISWALLKAPASTAGNQPGPDPAPTAGTLGWTWGLHGHRHSSLSLSPSLLQGFNSIITKFRSSSSIYAFMWLSTGVENFVSYVRGATQHHDLSQLWLHPAFSSALKTTVGTRPKC